MHLGKLWGIKRMIGLWRRKGGKHDVAELDGIH